MADVLQTNIVARLTSPLVRIELVHGEFDALHGDADLLQQ